MRSREHKMRIARGFQIGANVCADSSSSNNCVTDKSLTRNLNSRLAIANGNVATAVSADLTPDCRSFLSFAASLSLSSARAARPDSVCVIDLSVLSSEVSLPAADRVCVGGVGSVCGDDS